MAAKEKDLIRMSAYCSEDVPNLTAENLIKRIMRETNKYLLHQSYD